MQRIKDFVSGKLTYEQFEEMFSVDPSIWEIAQTLLTPEIMNDKDHPFWSKSNRNRLESNNFSVRSACLSFGFDIFGRVVTHRMLGELLSYQYPDIVLRDPPDVSASDLREKLRMDYLGGIEVDNLIDEILNNKDENTTVTKFVNDTKQKLRILFHLVPRKYPRWIQEPEWPMGEKSPMAYISQQRCGDMVEFIFQDADTNEQRIVKQFY